MNALQRSRRKATICPLTKKLGYRTKRQVIRAAERARQGKQKDPIPSPICFYLCPACKRWHLTSHPQKKVAA